MNPFATHEVLNQSPPFEDVNLFTHRPRAHGGRQPRGRRLCRRRLAAFGEACGSAAAFERGRLANENPPRLRPFDSKGRRLDVVEFHPAYHECMAMSVAEGLHCSSLGPPGASPAPSPAGRQRGALGRLLHGDPDGGGAPVPDHHDQRRGARRCCCNPRSPRRGCPRSWRATTTRASSRPRQARRHHRHGHDGEAGRHRRARQYHACRAGRRRRARRGVHPHRAQVVHVGADVRRLPGAGAGPGRAVVLPHAPLPARRVGQRPATSRGSRTSWGTAPMPPPRSSSRRRTPG